MGGLDELGALIAKHARGRRRDVLEGVILSSSTAPTLAIGEVVDPVMAIVAQGGKRVSLNDRVYTYGPGEFLVVSVELPITGQILRASRAEPLLGMALTLRPATIAAMLLDMAKQETRSQTAIGVAKASPELLDALIRMLRLLDRPEDIPVLWPMIEREVLWRLMTSPYGHAVRQIGLAESGLAQIRRAIQTIRARYTEPLRIEELAKLAGMSVTSFHRHFRTVTAMSPLQYQKQLRLHEARVRLLADPRDIAGIGFAVGYNNPSQFSREYRRKFGAPPSKTQRRA